MQTMMPGGADWTRGARPRAETDKPVHQDMLRASAFGRAKGQLEAALADPDPATRWQRIDTLLLKLVDFALDGADAYTILNGLVERA